MERSVMAKKPKAAPTRKTEKPNRPSIAVTLRGGPDWKEWLEGFADHCRSDVSKVIDKALIQYAKSEGYNREAPRR